MLNSLYIQNYVLIDNLDIRFDQGFSVITGETGAGKSISVGALSGVLGQRADGKSRKNDGDKRIIEGTREITNKKVEPFDEQEDRD